MNDVVQSPFGSQSVPARQAANNAVAQSDQQRAIAEVQAAMMIARMNPRDPIVAMDRILNACARPTLADSAVYTYSRGGSDVSGPSIRLAEAMAQSWGNMQFGIRELDQRNGESTVQAFAWDVETNTRREVTFQVPHIRYTRSGAKRLEDPRDIYEMVANQGARRLRACILAVIPGDVTEAAVAQCEVTMKAKADTTPEAMQKMVDAFTGFGVTREQIEKRIQRRLDAIQPAQVVALKKIYASLRDGMSAPADWFEVDSVSDAGDNASKAAAALSGAGGQEQKKPTGPTLDVVLKQIKAAQTADDMTAASESVTKLVNDDDKATARKAHQARMRELKAAAAGPTFAELADKLAKAESAAEVDVVRDLIRSIKADDQRAELEAMANARSAELCQPAPSGEQS